MPPKRRVVSDPNVMAHAASLIAKQVGQKRKGESLEAPQNKRQKIDGDNGKIRHVLILL
jgi:hypothetical protein